MRWIVSLSGGVGSYIALKREIAKHGKESVDAVFCDTLYEDGDLYRFLDDIERKLGVRIIRLCSGQTPTSLQFKDGFVYNSRVANCSRELKSKPFAKWLKATYAPEEATVVFGIDWTESHRCEAIRRNYAPYATEFPLCEEFGTKEEMKEEAYVRDGMKTPRLYRMGLAHNNCGGRCVKAGIGHWLTLLEKDRNRFLEAENEEEALRRLIGKDVAHLKRKGKPYTLKELREDADRQMSLFTDEERCEIGGCACFGGDQE